MPQQEEVEKLRQLRQQLEGAKNEAHKTDPPEHIVQFFVYEHLPPHLQEVSRPFAVLAVQLVAELPRNPERTVALRKLLEAKDAAVRARLAT